MLVSAELLLGGSRRFRNLRLGREGQDSGLANTVATVQGGIDIAEERPEALRTVFESN